MSIDQKRQLVLLQSFLAEKAVGAKANAIDSQSDLIPAVSRKGDDFKAGLINFYAAFCGQEVVDARCFGEQKFVAQLIQRLRSHAQVDRLQQRIADDRFLQRRSVYLCRWPTG